MTVDTNNIIVEHHGVKISIAQHRKVNKDVWLGDKPFVQEAMILEGPLRDTIYEYPSTLTGLEAVLVQIEEDLNRKENGE
tara:strand:+ start:406 stop:645 length:240 start_codon:yes stop_codon:yes gene_type:complete